MNVVELRKLIVMAIVMEVLKSMNVAYVVVMVLSMSVDVQNCRQMI